MKKKIIALVLIFLSFILTFFLKAPSSANAMLVDGGGGGSGFGSTIYLYGYNSGTTWRTRVDYKPYGGTRTTFYGYSGGSVNVGQNMTSNDSIWWLTACVDPESNVTIYLNVSCRSWDAASTSNCEATMNAASPISCGLAYGACGGPNDYPSAGSSNTYSLYANNLGTVGYGLCPIPNRHPGRDSQPDENKFRCSWGGYVTGVSYVGCRNTCTYRACGGTSTSNVYFYDTPYSTACGGNIISGSYMSCGAGASNYSYTCSPPAPTVTATGSCSGSTAQISTTWSTPSYSNGNYDLRWRVSGGSWHEVCSPSEPYVITGLSQGTTYQVEVRGNTTSGHNGPTAFGSDTVTTPSCGPNLVVSSLTVPNGNPGTSGNASVTVRNSGGQGTGVGFGVGFLRNGSSATCATSFSGEVSAGNLPAGSSTTVSVPFTYPAVGSYTAVAMADSNCGIAESNENDNTRTTTYSVTGCSISGNVYVDTNNNGVKDTGEVNYSGATLSFSGAGTGSTTTNTNGNYTFSGLYGSYTVTLTAPSGYTAPVTSQNATVCPNATLNFRLVPVSTITVHVYNDFNGNGVEDAVDTDSVGRTVVVTNKGAGTYTTNANGNVSIPNLTSGSSTITVAIPSGWSSTTTNPRTISVPPSQTVNFGLKPPAPTCSGGLTANPTTVYPGQTSTLTAVGCTSPTGDPLTYNWGDDPTIAGDSVNPTTGSTNTSTWTAPLPWWTQVIDHPTVTVCNPGNVCTSYTTAITIIPLFTISGNVFEDQNKDGLQNGGDKNYAAGISITSSGGTVTYPAPAGNYLISNLTGGTYTVSVAVPARYQITEPKNGPPPYFTVVVGNASTGGACSAGGSKAGACDVNGNITTLRFGISNSLPWIQSIGGDITGPGVAGSGGFTDPIPVGATCGSYSSLTGTGSFPGMIYSGAGTPDFGSGQASPDPFNWVVGGFSYPEPIKVNFPLVTSYANVHSLAQGSGTINNLSSYCGSGGISDCHLVGGLPRGFYLANGDLNLTGPSYTFPGGTSNPQNFIIMVNGDLNLNTEIHVPVGDTAFFTAAGNINVSENIGEVSSSSTRSNIEGYYSSDHFFYVKGVNSCPTTDLRLNIAGAIIVNAVGPSGSSTFVNQRDLCAQDLVCPAVGIIERPDFVLYSPEYLRTRRVWQEVAP